MKHISLLDEWINSLNSEVSPDADFSTKLSLLKSVYPEAVQFLQELRNAELAMSYIQTDSELRSKLPDIWQFQVQRCQEEVDQCLATCMAWFKKQI